MGVRLSTTLLPTRYKRVMFKFAICSGVQSKLRYPGGINSAPLSIIGL